MFQYFSLLYITITYIAKDKFRVFSVIYYCSYLKYHVHLSNVYDTLASHVVFGAHAIYAGFMPKHTFPLTDMVSYL